MKYIIREAEYPEMEYYFDGDGFTEASGDFCNTLFIICNDGWGRLSGFNIDTYKEIKTEAETILEGFVDVEGGVTNYDGSKITYKEIMQDNGWKFDATTCHKLKEWARNTDDVDTETVCEYLTIKTRKTWKSIGVHGYCQGDYLKVLYCNGNYAEQDARICGELYLGCGKEFGVIELDEDGNETDSCWGYFVADCQAWGDEDYKRIVCAEAGIDEAETTLEIIDGYTTITRANYRTA